MLTLLQKLVTLSKQIRQMTNIEYASSVSFWHFNCKFLK